jgi:class 3 adenylate cyclase
LLSDGNDTAQAEAVHSFVWEWHLGVSPERLWPCVSDTDRVNRLAGLPSVTYRTVPLEGGGSRVYAEIRLLGLIPLRYREHPFEWVENHRLSVRREFTAGPLHSYTSRVELFPETHGTHLVQTLSLWVRWPLIAPVLKTVLGRAQFSFGRVYEGFVSEMLHPSDNTSPGRWRSSVEAKTARMLRQISPPPDRDLLEKLTRHIATSEGRRLRHMRPFALAREFGHPKDEVLAVCLSAVRAGALNLNWNLLCPHCRDAKAQYASLGEVTPAAYCEGCNIDYEVEFDRSLEATFSPSPGLRRIREEIYCVGGPGNTPHVVEQFTLEPGGTHRADHNLPPGAYRIRCEKSKTYVSIRMTGEGTEIGGEGGAKEDKAPITEDRITKVRIAREGFVPFFIQEPAGTLRVNYTSEAAEETFIVLERAEWADDAATALDVAFFPEFRRIFGPDAIRPGENIAIQNVALMFTDLKGSTRMYEDIGDAVAYGVVRGHFNILSGEIRARDGHIVKTIGDAVMASFKSSEKAIEAAFAIQQKIGERNSEGADNPVIIKLGIHTGHAIAVNLNGGTDFFGTTVNIAARTQGESRGGDIVITDSVRREPAVEGFLSQAIFREEIFDGELKGIEESLRLHRLWPGED